MINIQKCKSKTKISEQYATLKKTDNLFVFISVFDSLNLFRKYASLITIDILVIVPKIHALDGNPMAHCHNRRF